MFRVAKGLGTSLLSLRRSRCLQVGGTSTMPSGCVMGMLVAGCLLSSLPDSGESRPVFLSCLMLLAMATVSVTVRATVRPAIALTTTLRRARRTMISTRIWSYGADGAAAVVVVVGVAQLRLLLLQRRRQRQRRQGPSSLLSWSSWWSWWWSERKSKGLRALVA